MGRFFIAPHFFQHPQVIQCEMRDDAYHLVNLGLHRFAEPDTKAEGV